MGAKEIILAVNNTMKDKYNIVGMDNLNSSNNEQVSILSKFFKIPKIEHDKDYNENEEYESIGE